MRASRLTALVAAIALAASLTGCSTPTPTPDEATSTPLSETASTSPNAAVSEPAFPVTIKHAFGNTTIEKQPDRIAAVGWANHEVPLALGVVPVGMSKATWGDDDQNGVLPWVEEKLKDLGAETPVLFDDTDGIDFDAVADTKPDVILASYSGITEEEYDTLSEIAPVVAYPHLAWGTSHEDMIALNSKAIGKGTEGQQLIDSLRENTAKALADHPELDGKKILFTYLDPSDLSEIGFYTSHDTRPGFMAHLGLPMPDVVVAESKNATEFHTTLSSKEAEKFADVDIVVTYGDPDGDLDGAVFKALQADPQLSKIPAIADGHIVVLPESTPIAASANPSPLSIPWGLDEYFDLLAEALK